MPAENLKSSLFDKVNTTYYPHKAIFNWANDRNSSVNFKSGSFVSNSQGFFCYINKAEIKQKLLIQQTLLLQDAWHILSNLLSTFKALFEIRVSYHIF